MQATRYTSRRPYASENVGQAAYGMTAADVADYKDQTAFDVNRFERNHFNPAALRQDMASDFRKVLPHEA